MNHISIDQSTVWKALQAQKPENLTAAFSAHNAASRIQNRCIKTGGGLSYSYGAMDASDETLGLLSKAAQELQLVEQYKALLSGEVMNKGERRMVLHHALRGCPLDAVVKDGFDYGAFYKAELRRFSDFANDIRAGNIRGSTGKAFTHIVQIGIGGSDLGPRALYLALAEWAHSRSRLALTAEFISNVDPDDANAVLRRLDAETSLFVLVSKSGTTQETLANEALVRAWLQAQGICDTAKHFVAVTAQSSPLAGSSEYITSFYIDDYIGGRYSATSAVGGVILSASLGPETFEAILRGAAEADALALNERMSENASMMAAMLGIFERNVLHRPSAAVLPYTQALSRFPAHLQQLDMESNGKTLKRDGSETRLATGPVIFGEPGTNGQHSFYQLLHQGSDIVPLEFIGFQENQSGFDPAFEGSSARTKLNANLAAQITAFACGSNNVDPNKRFSGQRPSSLIVGKELNPEALGALLAHYENKVMFQGFAWNINSFDQEGVQLGKKLTSSVLAMKSGAANDNAALAEYAALLGVL